MTDYQQAALTAMQDEIYRQLNCQYGDFNTPSNEEVKAILAAAEPHLRKKWAEEEAAKLAKTTVGLAVILDRFLESAEWESSGEEMAQKIIESVQNSLLKGATE